MQEVVHPNLQIRARSETNPLRKGLSQVIVEHANNHGAWLVCNHDHEQMVMERRMREGMDYGDEIFDDVAEGMETVVEEDSDVEDGESGCDSSDEDSDDSEEEDDSSSGNEDSGEEDSNSENGSEGEDDSEEDE